MNFSQDLDRIDSNCQKCHYFCGEGAIVCALHPKGPDSELCPDFKPIESAQYSTISVESKSQTTVFTAHQLAEMMLQKDSLKYELYELRSSLRLIVALNCLILALFSYSWLENLCKASIFEQITCVSENNFFILSDYTILIIKIPLICSLFYTLIVHWKPRLFPSQMLSKINRFLLVLFFLNIFIVILNLFLFAAAILN